MWKTLAAAPRLTLAALLAFAGLGASVPAAADDFAETFTAPIEKAHGLDQWRAHAAFEADLTVRFGGNVILQGSMLSDTAVGKVRMDLADGTVIVFDGQDAWVAPEDAAVRSPRFHVLTWPYFLAAPMKLRDPGTHLEDRGEMTLDSRAFPAALLTFDGGVGDSPEDWYILFREPESGRLAGMAYIVTFGTPVEKAEEEPHAIVYGDFEDLGGSVVSTRFTFYDWSAEEGIHGEPLGGVELSNVRFAEPAADAFTKPEGARRVDLPPEG